MNVLGEADNRISMTTHFIKRWKERIDSSATGFEIRKKINKIADKGNRYPINESHYRMCYEGICIIFMQLSPLHSLAKTVYVRDESTLSAV